MKQTCTFFIVLIVLNSCNAQRQKSVDYGYVTSDWTYKNDGLNLVFPLPNNWYFMDANTETLVKIGSDVNRLKAYTSAFQVPVEEFKKTNTNTIASLFEITKLDTSATVVAKPIDYNADKTIIVGLVYSDNSDSYSFLRATCSNCDDATFKKIFLKDVMLGNIHFDGYITGVIDNLGRKIGHFFGVKRINNLYLVCQFNFAEFKDYEIYKRYFHGFKLN